MPGICIVEEDRKAKTCLIKEYLKLRQKAGELEQYKQESQKSWEYLNRFKLLLSNITDMAYIFDAKGNIVYVNEAFERLAGRSVDELIGAPFAPLFDEENLRVANDAYSRTLKGERARFELCFKETRALCEYRNVPMRDELGKITGVMGIAREITARRQIEEDLDYYRERLEEIVGERTQELISANEELLKQAAGREKAEQALKDSESKYQALLDAANDAIFVADAERGTIIYANRKAEELIGLPASEIIGMHQTELHPEEDAEYYSKLFKKHVQSGNWISLEDVFVFHREGRKIPVEISASVSEINGRRIIHGIFRDISRRKFIDLEFRRFYAAVEQSPAAISITDIKGLIEYANPAFEKMTGYSTFESIGLSIKTVLTGLNSFENDRMWLTVLEGEAWRGGLRKIDKGGRLSRCKGAITPVKTFKGEIAGIVFTQWDCAQTHCNGRPALDFPRRAAEKPHRLS